MTDEERLALVRGCKWVDEVVIQESYDPTLEILDKNNCSHVAHGDDLVQTADGQDAYQPFKDSNRMKYDIDCYLEFSREQRGFLQQIQWGECY